MLTLHLIPNAHLDPVWLWDWREGLTEAVTTSQTILDLMDEFEELTFARGDAVYYRHVEELAPRIFRRIRRRIEEGRWEVVGGTHVQPDTNLPATETLLRHFETARHYFRNRFGRAPTVAWLPDSFGHSGGLPEILSAAGMKFYAFGRPAPHELPIARPAFWWVGQGGARILAYRTPTLWYGNERGDMPHKLDAYLAQFAGGDQENVAVPYGLGNHGGGPTRRMLRDIRQWAAAHPEIRVEHSTFQRFFEALRKEAQRKGPGFLPEHSKELNFCLRGCYASVAKLKFAYRRAEALTCRAEKISTAVHAALGRRPPSFAQQWDAILFNSFHDILPGSSIERACDEQLDWLGGAVHADRRAELAAIMALAEKVDTRVARPKGDLPTAVPFLIFNPHPFPFRGHVEIEPSLDYRPIAKYQNRTDEVPIRVCGPDGRSLPFQRIATEHYCLIDAAWRARLLVPVDVPPLGWTVLTAGWTEGACPPQVRGPAEAVGMGRISNSFYRLEARPGAAGLSLWREGQTLFGEEGLHLVTVEDPWGSWGGMREEPEATCLSQVRHRWKVRAVEILERGPERASLWVEMTGGRSRAELILSLCRGSRSLDVAARVLWNERAARLKLVLPGFGTEGEFEVPGGIAHRGVVGEVPGGR